MSTPQTVLVTGGPGFIGRRVVARFLAAGWRVRSFSLPGEPAVPDWAAPVDMLYGDLGAPPTVARAAEGVDLIIHLAAIVGVPGEYERQWRVIAEGTRNICTAAVPGRARLVVASSVAVYGDRIQTSVCREDDGFGAWQGAYGRAKQAQESIATEVAAEHNLPLTLLRPANVYGLGGASAWGDRLIALLRASGGGVIGDGHKNDAGLVFVENLADAIFLAGTHARAVGRTYNVCDEMGVSWRRFMDDMARLAGVPPPPGIPLDDLLRAAKANEDPARLIGPRDPAIPMLEGLNLIGFSNRIDSSRIRNELGWRPRIGYDDAMAMMAASLEEKSPA
jgi:2-alkyl-3-oxoalkanoate reductase